MALPSSQPADEEEVKKVACAAVFASASEPSRSVPSATLVLAKAPRPRRKKGCGDVASSWILALDDGDAMGMCHGEWHRAAEFCAIISSR
jgi:hypothetical protein